MKVIEIIFYFSAPLLIIKSLQRHKQFGFISPILLCYLVGIILGNQQLIPVNRELALSLSELAIPIAIPLILFSTDLKSWLKLAPKTILSFVLVAISAIVSAVVAGLLFSWMEEYWKISGMLVGVYTGGTPNLMAIGMGLKVKEKTLVLTNTADAIMGGLYFLFLVTGAQWFIGKVLPAFSSVVSEPAVAATEEEQNSKRALTFAIVLSIVIVGISVGISLFLTGNLDVSIIMLALTTLGIAASFHAKVRSIKGTYDAGQYFILVFSLALGTNINFREMFVSSSGIFLYTAFVMITAIVIHLILAWIFRIDTDTMLITSTAGIFGPAFIGPVAERLKNREVIVPGLTCGLVGYAIGNYLGFAVAWLLIPG
jgi:uncharacterized membrane protein